MNSCPRALQKAAKPRLRGYPICRCHSRRICPLASQSRRNPCNKRSKTSLDVQTAPNPSRISNPNTACRYAAKSRHSRPVDARAAGCSNGREGSGLRGRKHTTLSTAGKDSSWLLSSPLTPGAGHLAAPAPNYGHKTDVSIPHDASDNGPRKKEHSAGRLLLRASVRLTQIQARESPQQVAGDARFNDRSTIRVL